MEVRRAQESDVWWEDAHPRFRVHLYASGEDEVQGASEVYELLGADVAQAIDWAQGQAGVTRTYAISLAYDDVRQQELTPGRGLGQIWLIGRDAHASVSGEHGQVVADAHARMLRRRDQPIGIPSDDRVGHVELATVVEHEDGPPQA